MSARPSHRRPRSTAPSTGHRSSHPLVIPFVLVAACVLVYANSLQLPLLFDDRVTVLENAQVRELWTPAVLMPARELPVAGRPIANLSFALNYALHGSDVGGYHVVNLALHVGCALLVFGLIRRTLHLPGLEAWRHHADGLAGAAALLWAVHPLNSEVVNYLTQRTESLMALALLTTLYCSLRAPVPMAGPTGTPAPSASAIVSRPGPARRWETAAIIACLAGMACKETMAIAPLLVVLFDVTFRFGSLGQAWRARGRFYLLLAATWILLAALLATSPRGLSAGFSAGVSSWTYLLNQAPIVARYLRLVVWPVDLVANYGAPRELAVAQVVLPALVVVAALAATSLAMVRWPMVGFLGAWVFVTLAPTSSIVPIATEVGAERRMYLASMALVTGLVLLVWSRVHSVRARLVAVSACAVALGAATIVRNGEYRTGLTLAETSVARWPSPTATLMLGTELAAAGRAAEALPHLRAAALQDGRARYHLGVALFNAGDLDGARQELRQFVEQQPELLEVVPARAIIGRTLAAQSRWAEAIGEFEAVLRMAPGNNVAGQLLVSALGNQGAALAAEGRLEEAVKTFRRAVALAPQDPAAQRNLAVALFDARDAAAAREPAEQAVRLSPGDAPAHNVLGRILAVLGDITRAHDELATAVRLAPSEAGFREDLERLQLAAPAR